MLNTKNIIYTYSSRYENRTFSKLFGEIFFNELSKLLTDDLLKRTGIDLRKKGRVMYLVDSYGYFGFSIKGEQLKMIAELGFNAHVSQVTIDGKLKKRNEFEYIPIEASFEHIDIRQVQSLWEQLCANKI